MNFLELFLGQIPEAIFLTLFVIYAKNLKDKRVIFTIIMLFEYLLLKYTFRYNWYFHVGLLTSTFLTLKVLYRERAQITDIFIILISYIVLMITSALCFMVCLGNVIPATITNRIIIFGLLFHYKEKLNCIQKLYKKYWNRNDKPKLMKSATFRSMNVVIFNVVFAVFNIGMVYVLYLVNKGGG